jgi:hypothetical protein
VRFETTPRWDADWKALKSEHKRQFRDVVPDFNAACDAYAQAYDRAQDEDAVKEKAPAYRWPAALRVSPMKSAAGVWEMTWSFASPDGRATFEFVSDKDGLILRWRRIGDHGIYKTP